MRENCPEYEDQLSPTQVARILGVGEERVRQLDREGHIHAYHTILGRLFSRTEIEAFQATRQPRRAVAV